MRAGLYGADQHEARGSAEILDDAARGLHDAMGGPLGKAQLEIRRLTRELAEARARPSGRTCLVIHRTGLSDLTSKQSMVEVPAWETGVPGLVLTPPITQRGATDLRRGVQVTHEPTGKAVAQHPISINNARRYVMELGRIEADWTALREPTAEQTTQVVAAWSRAQERDQAEIDVAFDGLTEDEESAIERMETSCG